VARQRGGGWSAPCAVALAGVGWGLQLGAALADVVLVLRDEGALSSLTAGGASLGLGVSACAAAGPFGRVAAVSLTAGVLAPGANGSTAAVCCARGVLLGAAVEGSAVVPRDAINRAFYGRHVSARALLLDGVVARPPAGALLYDALLSLEQRCMAVGSAQSEQRPPVRRHCSSRSGAAAEASSNSDRRAACHAVAASAPPAPLNVLADLACAAPGRQQCVPAAGGAGAQGSTGGGDGGLAELPAVPQHAAVAAELLDGRREQQQQQQQQGSAGTDKAEQEEEEEEEEQQYVLEW
jgi:Las17-binding protein actin regulator